VPSLREVQRKLAAVFTHPGGVRPGLTAAGFHARRRPVTETVADQPPVPLHTRLAVYSDAYFLRLSEVLGDDFRAVKRALGEDDFRRLAADYLRIHPSRTPLINDVGAGLPAFLAKHPFSRKHPFLPDLARLERAALRALFVERAPRRETVEDPAPDPTVSLLETRWAVDRLWAARSLPPGKGLRRLSSPALRRLLVWRDDDWARVQPLDPVPFAILQRLSAGKPLAAALRGLENKITVPEVRRTFARWVRDGVLKNKIYVHSKSRGLRPGPGQRGDFCWPKIPPSALPKKGPRTFINPTRHHRDTVVSVRSHQPIDPQ
jgi:hypothetical protein